VAARSRAPLRAGRKGAEPGFGGLCVRARALLDLVEDPGRPHQLEHLLLGERLEAAAADHLPEARPPVGVEAGQQEDDRSVTRPSAGRRAPACEPGLGGGEVEQVVDELEAEAEVAPEVGERLREVQGRGLEQRGQRAGGREQLGGLAAGDVDVLLLRQVERQRTRSAMISPSVIWSVAAVSSLMISTSPNSSRATCCACTASRRPAP